METYDPTKDDTLKKMIREEAIVAVREYMKSVAFTDKKITDTPTDSLSTVNRKYVNLSGTVANRPSSSVATVGQSYLATDTNIPMRWTGSAWVNGIGSVVAI